MASETGLTERESWRLASGVSSVEERSPYRIESEAIRIEKELSRPEIQFRWNQGVVNQRILRLIFPWLEEQEGFL